MQNILSASDIANEMSMMRTAFKGTFLVVEGASDSRLYTKFIDLDSVKIIVAHSKDNVMKSVAECRNRRKDTSVLGIVDSDLDPFLGRKRLPPVFTTDRRDMESTIMSTSALGAVLSEYGDTEKIKTFEERNGDIGDAVAKAASPLGYLMLVSYRKGMNLSFKDVDHSAFVNARTLRTDIPKMVSAVYGMSMSQMYPRQAIADLVAADMVRHGPSWDMSRGHDAVSILLIGLKNCFGSYNARSLTKDELGGSLRIAYDDALFLKSRLYESTRKWCEGEKLALWKKFS